jgi:uncharacterized cupin superfamily protein
MGDRPCRPHGVSHGRRSRLAGRFHADFGAFGECIRILSGEVRCTPDDGGEPFTLRAGDWMTFPRGWTGEWAMPTPTRKVYVTWEAR